MNGVNWCYSYGVLAHDIVLLEKVNLLTDSEENNVTSTQPQAETAQDNMPPAPDYMPPAPQVSVSSNIGVLFRYWNFYNKNHMYGQA